MEGFYVGEDKKDSIFVPKICFGGFCIEGDDVKHFVELLQTKYDECDERLRRMEGILDNTLRREKEVKEVMRDVDRVRVESLSAIEREMQMISATRRKTAEEFEAKIAEMERERKKSADLIDSLVQKRVPSS